MIASLMLLPVVAAILVFFIKRQSWSKRILVSTSVIHLTLVLVSWNKPSPAIFNGWFAIDKVGLLFLTIVSILFLTASIYSLGYLVRSTEPRAGKSDSAFVACLLLFLATMTMVTVCQQFELLWVAIEATTLASAPLIYFHRNQHSLEATWKYLIICSVSIALALLGNFFLSISISSLPGVASVSSDSLSGHGSMVLSELLKRVPVLESSQIVWLRTSFVFLFVGYGTKMGLAPLHTWLPDAHSEAPSLVSSLLSGASLNCAFLGILRAFQVCGAAHQAQFAQTILVSFGLFSLAFAAVFIVRQNDFKRLLAYSSVEHMGLLAIGVGLGGTGVFASMFHAVNHSLTKAMLFLLAGNLLHVYGSKSIQLVRGAFKVVPYTALLWFLGLFAISGLPPFGTFVSEFLLLKTAFDQGRYFVAAAILFFLAVVFVGMASAFLKIVMGPAPEQISVKHSKSAEHLFLIVPPVLLIIPTLVFGIYIPPFLKQALETVARLFGGI